MASAYTGIPLDQIDEIKYFLTLSNISPHDDCTLHKLCENSGIKLTLIGIDQLAEELYRKYPSLIKQHLSLPIDTEQIQTIDDFVFQYDARKLAATLSTPFQFRQNELDQIDAAFRTKNVVVLTGNAGTGKTRLALQFARQHAEASSETCYCIHD